MLWTTSVSPSQMKESSASSCERSVSLPEARSVKMRSSAPSFGLDLRLSHTPRIGRLGRRLSLALEVFALPAGVDLLLHGSEGLRGWGQGRRRTEDVLLHPRGFDPAAGRFEDEVNERFGRSLEGAMGTRSPFGLQLSGRLAVGPEPEPDPLGGYLALGRSGGAGGTRVTMTLGPGEAPPPGVGGLRVTPSGGGTPGGGSMLDLLLPMPLDGILALADSLGLSAEQRERVREIRAALLEVNAPIRAEVGRAIGGGAAVPTENPAALFDRVGPRLNEGRVNVQRALDRVREALTPEQWERIPAGLREAAVPRVRVGGE